MRARLVSAAILVVASVSMPGAWQPGRADVAAVSGELRQWHKVTLTFTGPQASETDSTPNPFTDYRMSVTFTHETGWPRYKVPGYFAADGDAANTSASPATSGARICRRTRPAVGTGGILRRAPGVAVTPARDRAGGRAGRRRHRIVRGRRVQQDRTRLSRQGPAAVRRQASPPICGIRRVLPQGGPDSPETLLAYEDFDNTAHTQEAIHTTRRTSRIGRAATPHGERPREKR